MITDRSTPVAALGAALLLTLAPPFAGRHPRAELHPPAPGTSALQPLARLTHDEVAARVDSLRGRLDALSSQACYLVIDTVHNRLQVRRGGTVLREATCATGSGSILLGDRDQVWRFTSPVRALRVLRKVTDPIWQKPEWAFVEAGGKAPVLPWEFDRLDAASLGEYALELGDGIEIHGTLYPNLLGRHITHGCIRLDDGDLSAVFGLAQPGTMVYLY